MCDFAWMLMQVYEYLLQISRRNQSNRLESNQEVYLFNGNSVTLSHGSYTTVYYCAQNRHSISQQTFPKVLRNKIFRAFLVISMVALYSDNIWSKSNCQICIHPSMGYTFIFDLISWKKRVLNAFFQSTF